MSKFVISKRTNGEYQFSLLAENGQVILTSEGYSAKAGCENGIESVRVNALESIRFDRKTSSNGKFYFNLKASNGQIIGSSQMYEAESGRDRGIESVVKNVQNAKIEDNS